MRNHVLQYQLLSPINSVHDSRAICPAADSPILRAASIPNLDSATLPTLSSSAGANRVPFGAPSVILFLPLFASFICFCFSSLSSIFCKHRPAYPSSRESLDGTTGCDFTAVRGHAGLDATRFRRRGRLSSQSANRRPWLLPSPSWPSHHEPFEPERGQVPSDPVKLSSARPAGTGTTELRSLSSCESNSRSLVAPAYAPKGTELSETASDAASAQHGTQAR